MTLAFTGTLAADDRAGAGGAHRPGAAVRHGAARRADRRHHAAGLADRRDGDRAHHLRHRAHLRRAHRRRHVRGDRHRAELCGDHGVLSARRDPDLEHGRAGLGARPRRCAAEAAENKPSPWRELREGIVLVWNTPRLLAIVWYALLFNFAVFPLTNGLMPYAAKEIFHTDQTGLGYLIASVAVGAFVGSIIMTRSGMTDGARPHHDRRRRDLAHPGADLRADDDAVGRHRHADAVRLRPEPDHGLPHRDPAQRLEPALPRPDHGGADAGDLQPAGRACWWRAC